MRIENYRVDVAAGSKPALQPPHAGARRPGSAAATPTEHSTHTPAPELAAWVAQLRRLDDVRHDVIGEVKRRLSNGQYLTPEATERAVEAMLS
jgi:hypothetical protein